MKTSQKDQINHVGFNLPVTVIELVSTPKSEKSALFDLTALVIVLAAVAVSGGVEPCAYSNSESTITDPFLFK